MNSLIVEQMDNMADEIINGWIDRFKNKLIENWMDCCIK